LKGDLLSSGLVWFLGFPNVAVGGQLRHARVGFHLFTLDVQGRDVGVHDCRRDLDGVQVR
jgi:hypothetical protein